MTDTLAAVRTLRQVRDEPPEPGAVIDVPFEADLQGERVTVLAVLERTAVYERPGARAGERQLARLEALVPVEPLGWVLPDLNAKREAAKRGRRVALTNRQARASGGEFKREPVPRVCLGEGERWCGTVGGYTNHACRGAACTAAGNVMNRRWRTRSARPG